MLCFTAFSVPRWKSSVLAEILQSPRDTSSWRNWVQPESLAKVVAELWVWSVGARSYPCHWGFHRCCSSQFPAHGSVFVQVRCLVSKCGGMAMAGSQTPASGSLTLLLKRKGREKGRSGMRKLICWNEGREITFSYHHGQNRLDLRKIELIYCQLFMYLINYLGIGRQKG